MSDLTLQEGAAGQATILVVDDERGPRESLRMILQPTHEVLCARDGLEALEILRTRTIDLVTLDLNMPGIQGEELMRTIRREFPNVELIVITGYGTLENAAEAVRYGVSDYLQMTAAASSVTASSAGARNATRASPMSRRRVLGSRSRQRRSNRTTCGGVSFGRRLQSTSSFNTAAIASDTVSPSNVRRPVSIS